MKTTYEPNLKANISTDDRGKVRHIRHNQEFWESGEDVSRVSAESYLNTWAETLQIPKEQLQNLNKPATFYDPRKQGVEYQRHEEKQMFDSITVGYYQTFLNTPVWRKGLSVKIKQNPDRVVGATNNSEDDLKGSLPKKNVIENYKQLFAQLAVHKTAVKVGLGGTSEGEDELTKLISKAVGDAAPQKGVEPLSAKFFIYKYDPEKRLAGKPSSSGEKLKTPSAEVQETPIPELPPVSGKIKSGRAYLVAEIVFIANLGGLGPLSWLILVELETGSVLYIECMAAGVNGMVFRRDPMVRTGDLTITSDDNNGALNPQAESMALANLVAPVGTVQSLTGTYVTITERENPVVAAPTQTTGTDFNYDARTNNFGAVNAYYHQTELFRTIESLGFPIATYFDGTTFPIPVDHRGLGNVINAHCVGNTSGTLHMCFALCDTTNTAEPLCRAVDPWVHWHEMGGHGLLYDHVGSANLGFSHSAGDGLAALQMDPESALRGVLERFRYAPFRPIGVISGISQERRFDRDVLTWAWGSEVVTGPAPNFPLISGDDGAYGSEQILATCHFRIYRSIGGDSDDVARRNFASRMVTYLILRTIGSLTPGTNPTNAQVWCEDMQDVDLENWTSETLSGGAYNKVIRWAFEKQGCYQPAGAPTPVTTPGDPPEVDVYIDDGRHGEYQYAPVHWENESMWNRNVNDSIREHRPAIAGEQNFMFAEIKNRGTNAATNVRVKAFHSLPGAGLTWPIDFVEMSPVGGLPVASIPSDSMAGVIVGPFQWVPNINAFGHDCVLMIASADGDPSNVDNFTGTETIQEWRLVPNDNNVGQRNVQLASGESGESLLASLDGAFFMAGNNLNKAADMELRVDMPKVLKAKRWRLSFDGIPKNTFRLKSGEKRKIVLKLEKGAEFTSDEIRASKLPAIRVRLFADGLLLGGMSYSIDPDPEKRRNGDPGRITGRVRQSSPA